MTEETRGVSSAGSGRPPRPHGGVRPDRNVSFLELFYDLVYVAVIAQAAHHLAEHVTERGVVEFAVIFSLIWVAWVNGSLYVELHGRDDGRTRNLVFIQMAILALLAVFTADAAGATGAAFAVVYAAFMAVMTWQWNAVRRQDHAEFRAITGRYVTGMLVSTAVILASALLPPEPRLVAWAAISALWVAAIVVAGRSPVGLSPDVMPTRVAGRAVRPVHDHRPGGGRVRRRRWTVPGGPRRDDDRDGHARARHRVRLLVDLLRCRRPATATRRRAIAGELAAEPPPDHAVHRGGRGRHHQPHLPRARCRHAREHRVARVGLRRAGPARADRHRAIARRCRAPRRRLPAPGSGHRRGRRRRSSWAGSARRRGSSPHRSGRSCRCSGSSRLIASWAPTPGARRRRSRRPSRRARRLQPGNEPGWGAGSIPAADQYRIRVPGRPRRRKTRSGERWPSRRLWPPGGSGPSRPMAVSSSERARL